MKNLNKFIKKLFELNIEIANSEEDSFLILEHYFETDQSYATKLKILAEMAVSDILILTPEQVKWQLTRFDRFRTNLCQDVDDCLTIIDSLLERDKEKFEISEWLFRIGKILNINLNHEILEAIPIRDINDFVNQLNEICEIKSNVLEEFYENLKTITQQESKYDRERTKALDKQEGRTFGQSDWRSFSYHLIGVSEGDFDDFYAAITPYVEATREEVHNVFYVSYLSDITPLKWKSNNASELLYFITQLMDKGLLKEEKRIDYHRLKACFVKTSGSEFDESFKDLLQKLNTSLSIVKREAIDKLIEKFL